MSHAEDRELEEKWREVTLTVPFKRDHETGELILPEDWWIFEAKTKRKDIWGYFDERHSKGIGHLLQRIAWWRPDDGGKARAEARDRAEARVRAEAKDRAEARVRDRAEARDRRRAQDKDKDKGESGGK